ncbi:MAG: hypothetical protein HOO94_02470 [Novosphingobium sp.]|uniref:hypothetical protein n=1 Tax=Novosphingobium sp. TaxID=1874826 RepID=UPI0018360355|nr:hypothetical protein [Novosphingobium sp.]
MARNPILAEIVRKGGGKLLNTAVAKALPGDAEALPARKTLLGGIAGALAVRLATRSVPGAIVVGGGILAKSLYDRRRARRAGATGKDLPKT